MDAGFNDQGEMLPLQGGTNEVVVNKMYKVLNLENKQDNLHVYWYTAKDQKNPISAASKKRNCHGNFFLLQALAPWRVFLTSFFNQSSSWRLMKK